MDLSGILSGGVAGSLHIEGDGDKIDVTPVLTSGEKIATITINEGSEDEQVIDLYAPEGFSGSWNDLTDKPTLFSGVYGDLTSKPTLNGDTIDGNMYTAMYNSIERRVGTWIDGKPLYQKTFDCGALPNAQTKEVSFTEDIEMATIINAFAMSTNEGFIICIPDITPNYLAGSVRVYISKTAKKICIYSQADVSTYDKSYVTIQYTKTTDS